MSTVGIDVGGTKTHLAAQSGSGRTDRVVPSSSWRSGELFSDPRNLTRLAALIAETDGIEAGTQIVVGLHGCDSAAQLKIASSALSSALPCAVHVCNDAELLGWAAGIDTCMKMIVGTGSVVVGTTESGDLVTASGYGWLLSDEGSAPSLVGDALRRVFRAIDEGTDSGDPLLPRMLEAFGAADATALALLATDKSGMIEWGIHAPLIFESADAGSTIARRAVDRAAERLAASVAAVSRRGAVGIDVVAAGSVIVRQPRLQNAVARAMAVSCPTLALHVLDVPPVTGALAWAEHLRGLHLQAAS